MGLRPGQTKGQSLAPLNLPAKPLVGHIPGLKGFEERTLTSTVLAMKISLVDTIRQESGSVNH